MEGRSQSRIQTAILILALSLGLLASALGGSALSAECPDGQSSEETVEIDVITSNPGSEGAAHPQVIVSGNSTVSCPGTPPTFIPGQPGSLHACHNEWIRWPYPTDQPFEFATGVPAGLVIVAYSGSDEEIDNSPDPDPWESEIDDVAQVMGGVIVRLADPDGYHHWYNPPDAHPWWEYRPHWRVCEGRHRLRYGWVDPRPPVPPDFRPGQPGYLFIESLLKVHVPTIGIGVSPRFDGLTGLETYYWVEGLGGEGTLTIGPEPFRDLMVEVKASASHFRWEFGDDAGGMYYTVGKPYPSRSEIRHTYRTKSSRHPHAEQDGTYLVTVDGTLDVEFRVFQAGQTPGADEGWVTRPPITVSASRSYRVVEVVGVLTR